MIGKDEGREEGLENMPEGTRRIGGMRRSSHGARQHLTKYAEMERCHRNCGKKVIFTRDRDINMRELHTRMKYNTRTP